MKKYELNPREEILKSTILQNVIRRNDKIIGLMRLLNSINENYVISIDGDWGTGKTFFIKQMMYIKDNYTDFSCFTESEKSVIDEFANNYFIVYYNAWQNDNHVDVVESLIYNILNEYPKLGKDLVEDSKFDLLKNILMNFIDKSSFGIIKKEDLQKMESFSDLAKSINTMEEKKEKLEQLLSQITDKRRILLVVDELDRCKPDYAVKMLETLKHFYTNDKMSTLVVTNNNQLVQTIKHFYGLEFDGYRYLNKIYDTVITIKTEYVEEYAKYYLEILKQTHLPENISLLLFKYLKFTYRECNKYMSMYRIIEPYTNYPNAYDTDKCRIESNIFLPIAIALKIKNLDDYDIFMSGKADEFLKSFFNKEWLDQEHFGYYSWFCNEFDKAENEELIDIVLKNYKSIFNSKRVHGDFPYMEAISMLGNIVFEDETMY